MNKLWFWLKNYKKLSKIKIEYSLITMSGKEITSVKEKIKPIKPFIVNYDSCDYGDYCRNIENDKEYKKIFDKRAEELLNDSQKQERKHLKNGWLDSGSYIVKCVWDIFFEFEKATYEEVEQNLKSLEK